jgi:hypothetical protein
MNRGFLALGGIHDSGLARCLDAFSDSVLSRYGFFPEGNSGFLRLAIYGLVIRLGGRESYRGATRQGSMRVLTSARP